SVKVILDKTLCLAALRAYNADWTFNDLSNNKEPLLVSVSGSMRQQPIQINFIGITVEEKFHLRAVYISILPCIPLVSNKLKKLVHPSIAPVEIEEGQKQGYFVVNLSKNQTF
ncbi:hypothetical protein BD408DRAFT_329920, partial [Parasitella parasitica]